MADYVGKAIGGAGSGAAAGAAIGSVVPGWGTAIGAIAGGALGLVGGLFSAAAEEDDAENRRELIAEAAQQLKKDYNEVEQAFGEFYKQYDLAKAYGYTDKAGNVDLNKLGEVGRKIQNWDNQVNQRLVDSGQATIDPITGKVTFIDQKFSFDHDTNGDGKTDALDFVNPYMGNVIDASNAAVQHSAAGAGLGRSTGAAKAIAENTAKEYDKLYNTALGQYNTERSQSYNEWADYLSRQQDRFKTLLQSDQWGLTAQQGLVDSAMAQQGERAENLANLRKDLANQNANIALAGL